MKLNKILIIFSIILAAALSACKEDIDIPAGGELSEMNYDFPCLAAYHQLSVPGGMAWEITEHADWLTPKPSGEAGSAIKVYVQDNVRETLRTGQIKAALSDGSTVVYNLTQQSILTLDDNSVVTNTDLTESRGVGHGINVLTQSGFSTGKYTLSFAPLDLEAVRQYVANIGEADAFVDEDRYYSETKSFVGSSTTSVANQLSVAAGIEASIGAFEGKVSGAFSENTQVNEKTGYGLRSIKHVVASRYLRPGILREAVRTGHKELLASYFLDYCEDLLKYPGDDDVILDIINTYGTHVIVYGELGGELQIALEMKSTENIKESDISAALEITAAKAVSGSASVDISQETKSFSKESKVSFCSYGGNNPDFSVEPGSSFENAMATVLSASNLNNWVDGLKGDKDKQSLALIDIKVIPIYELIADEACAERVKRYIMGPYQEKITKHSGLVYAINGYTDMNQGLLSIPEIDTTLEVYSENIPEISINEKSTVIYSGNSYGVNYDVGFFIGSSTNKPGKIVRKRGDRFEYQPFDDLSAGRIETIYTDASGNVTIAHPEAAAAISTSFKEVTLPRADINPYYFLNVQYEDFSVDSHFFQNSGGSWVLFNNGLGGKPKDLNSYRTLIDFGAARLNFTGKLLKVDEARFMFYDSSGVLISMASIKPTSEEWDYNNKTLNISLDVPRRTNRVIMFFPASSLEKDEDGNIEYSESEDYKKLFERSASVTITENQHSTPRWR